MTPLDSGKTNSSGTLTFPNNTSKLAPGLYLVSGKDHSDKVYSYKTSPFLIKLPSWDSVNKKEIYNVYAQPKFSADKITDSPDSSVTGIKVSKVWKDDIESKRPSEVTVQLLKDGKVYDQTTLNKSNGWQHIWKDLPKHNPDKSEIKWLVAEKNVPGYAVSLKQEGNTFIITNTFRPHGPADKDDGDKDNGKDEDEDKNKNKTEYHVLKVWDDKGNENKRPDSVTVSLFRNKVPFDSKILNQSNNWQHTWYNLEKYDENGKMIEWSVSETPVLGYQTSIAQRGNHFIVTNRFIDKTIPQTGQLWWPVPILIILGLLFLMIGFWTKRYYE